MIQDQYTEARRQLQENMASRVSHEDTPMQSRRELSRNWGDVSPKMQKECVNFLNLYSSADNAAPQYSVENPQADQQVFPGIWRNVGAQMSTMVRGLRGVTQVLRYGFATTIDWTEAFAVSGTANKTTERDIVVEFRNIDPAYINDCIVALNSVATYTNPTIQGETFTGTWQNGGIGNKQQDDGAHTITLKIGLISTVATITDLSNMTPYKEWIRDIEEPFGPAGGYSTHASVSNSDGIIYTYPRISVASESAINGLTDANFQSLVNNDSSLYEFINKDLKENSDDQTVTLKLIFKRIGRRSWGTTPGRRATADLTVKEDAGATTTLFEKHTHYWFGIQYADNAVVVSDLGTTPGNGDSATTYIVTRVQPQDNRDGTKTYAQSVEYARAWPAANESSPTPDYKETINLNGRTAGERWIYNSYKSESSDAAIARAKVHLDALTSTGYIIDVSIQDRRNGIFDVVYTKSLDGSTFSIPGWTIGLISTQYWKEIIYADRKKDGKKHYRVIMYAVEYYSHSTLAAAWSYLNGKSPSGLASSPMGIVTKVETIDKYKYMSVYVTSNEIADLSVYPMTGWIAFAAGQQISET